MVIDNFNFVGVITDFIANFVTQFFVSAAMDTFFRDQAPI
jgi:hypothetical protein